jgi:RNA polymerase sigma-70 factor (ECF subfamily)
MAATDWDEATFEAYRPLLFSIAYRMPGSASDAEDVIQDLRASPLSAAQMVDANPRATLSRIVTAGRSPALA